MKTTFLLAGECRKTVIAWRMLSGKYYSRFEIMLFFSPLSGLREGEIMHYEEE